MTTSNQDVTEKCIPVGSSKSGGAIKHGSRESRGLFKIGVALLVVNVPFGYGGMALCGILAAATKQAAWLWTGAIVYGVSWLMLGLGVLFAGKEGLRYAKDLRKRLFKRKS